MQLRKSRHNGGISNHRYLLPCLLYGFLIFFTSASGANEESDLYQKRLIFLKAESAFKSKQYHLYEEYLTQLNDYPLYPYLIYRQLRHNIDYISSQDVRLFLYKYNDSPLADKLRSDWLRQLAKRGLWPEFINNYTTPNTTSMECTYRKALYKTGNKDKAFKDLDKFWLINTRFPKSCHYILSLWINNNSLKEKTIVLKIENAVSDGNIALATTLSNKYLPSSGRAWANDLLTAHNNPQEFFNRQYLINDQIPNDYNKTLITHGLIRLSKKDLDKMLVIWRELKEMEYLSDDDMSQIEKSIVRELLTQEHYDPLPLLAEINPKHLDDISHNYAIRIALKQGSWVDVIGQIDALPKSEQQDEVWLYWRARALENLGNVVEAKSIYRKLAKERSFYGFISADKLSKDYSMGEKNYTFDKEALLPVSYLQGVKRAYELYKIGRLADARREWTNTIYSLSDENQYKAAKLAHQWGWHDQAILTIAKSQHMDDLDLRFPMAHKDIILKESNHRALDPAWIYALIRQESIFMRDARSTQGALGLMQLMPQTAYEMGRVIRKKIRKKYDILNINNNISLGTTFLRRSYDKFDKHPVLATAAYNAGPSAVKRWLPENDLIPSDLWIETIPYNETRNYVQRVLTYTAIYETRMGREPTPLKLRMPPINTESDYKDKKNSPNTNG